MKIHVSKSAINQKRTWIIVCAIVIIAALIGIWTASSLRHAKIITEVDQAYAEAKATAKAVSTSSKASRDNRLKAINKLSKAQTIVTCSGEWWSGWYDTLLPTAKAEVDDCIAKLKKLNAVSRVAARANVYLDDDAKVAKTLAVMKVATGSGNRQKTALSSVESALRDIEAMAVTGDNKVLIVASKEKLTVIITAWNALNEASSKEDKMAYQKAEGQLAQAYADLGAISDASDTQVKKLIVALQVTIHKL